MFKSKRKLVSGSLLVLGLVWLNFQLFKGLDRGWDGLGRGRGKWRLGAAEAESESAGEAERRKMDEMRRTMRLTNNGIQQDDHFLVRIIRESFMMRPSNKPYGQDPMKAKALGKDYGGQHGQGRAADDYFKHKRNGFFIEVGAWNGVYLSNTLYLEMERNWTGLLIEANTKAFNEMIDANRKAYCIHACLALKDQPEEVVFDGADVFGGVRPGGDGGKGPAPDPAHSAESSGLARARDALPPGFRRDYTVQCFPLYSMLLSLGNPRVDFFSLDVEGAELDILKTLPWDLVHIETLAVEVHHKHRKEITQFLADKGYRVHKEFKDVDLMFVKES